MQPRYCGQILTFAGGLIILREEPGSLIHAAAPPLDRVAQGRTVTTLIQEFWRCISLLPAVIGRQELLVAFRGLGIELNLVSDLLLISAEVVRDHGVKNLNAYLPTPFQQYLEEIITLPQLSAEALLTAHFKLAQLVQQEGRRIAEQWSVEYPEKLEAVVCSYVQNEMELLGLSSNNRAWQQITV